MKDLEQKLITLWIFLNGIWHRKRYIIIASWLICLIGWSAVSTLKNQYETKARVYADTTSILRPLLHGIAVQEDTKQEVQVTSRTLLSRSVLNDIAQGADLHLKYPTPEAYDNLLDRLKDQIKISGSARTNVYDIEYQNEDPSMAMRVVELTLKEFVDTSAGRSRTDANSAAAFLDEQIHKYQNRLESSEEKLANFKRENQAYLPEKGRGYYSSLATLKDEQEDIRQAISEKNAQINGLKKRFIPKTDASQNENANNGVTTRYDSRIESLENALEQLRINYTEKHPNIIEIKRRLKLLRERQGEEQKMLVQQATSGALTPSSSGESQPLQQFSLKVSELESEKDVLETRLRNVTEELGALESKLDLIPKIEAQLKDLQRDYQNDQEYYQKLLQRRDSAQISRNADEQTQDVKFKILDEPRKANKPVGPPRGIMYIGVYLMSLGVGLGLAFISSQLNNTISGAMHLGKVVGKDRVTGIIPHIEREKRQKRHRIKVFIFIFSIGSLTALLAALLVHEAVFGQSPLIWLKG